MLGATPCETTFCITTWCSASKLFWASSVFSTKHTHQHTTPRANYVQHCARVCYTWWSFIAEASSVSTCKCCFYSLLRFITKSLLETISAYSPAEPTSKVKSTTSHSHSQDCHIAFNSCKTGTCKSMRFSYFEHLAHRLAHPPCPARRASSQRSNRKQRTGWHNSFCCTRFPGAKRKMPDGIDYYGPTKLSNKEVRMQPHLRRTHVQHLH